MNDDKVENLEVEGLNSKLESESDSNDEDEDEDVKLTEASKNSEQEVDVNDDLAWELAFYTQALEGKRQAFVKFESMRLPFLRPSDYYAERVKTDTHMERVKCRLLVEKRKIEEAEEMRKACDV
ncbi:probable rRNA-processing protein EBP2 homolog [Camellia sinensis]|uniref:probable rRNA-processing protein EBP2 homolog n=1 Tax=Camellia sinensis TaxID=4442 RepID=UPI0010362E96|nr:probable rRNA-processing protein EBP2 homolog [Camellia sinensis]